MSLTERLLDELGGARLLRAQTLLGEGRVELLSVEAGVLRARVTGQERYAVQLWIEPRPRAPLRARLQGAPVLPGRALLPGPLPEAVVRAVLPARLREVSPRCSCPDGQDWCKHAMATLLQAGEGWASDAEGLLRWRGLRREALLEAVLPPTPTATEGFWTARGPLPRPRRGEAPTLTQMPPLDIQGRSAQEVLGAAVEDVQRLAAHLLSPDRK